MQNKGTGLCKNCGKLVEVSPKAVHQCPIDENEYPIKFRELIVLCRAHNDNPAFKDWVAKHAMNDAVRLTILSDIRGIASIEYDQHDYRYVNLVKNSDSVYYSEVD